ncbi:MAG: FAD:protein FMN transferase, partial [Planctomycetaceae bacterium]|nr:FAD:protein FMN transferase [Planctomycetaceae bacterium]
MRLLISLFFSFGLLHSPVVAEMETLSGRTMGTTYTIKFFSEEQAVHEIPDLVENRLAEINRLMSTYDPESELSRFNQSTTTDWFSVAPDTAFVVKRALEIHQLSGGAFDPTVGRLVKLWSFGEGDRTYAPPPADPLREAKDSMGADLV